MVKSLLTIRIIECSVFILTPFIQNMQKRTNVTASVIALEEKIHVTETEHLVKKYQINTYFYKKKRNHFCGNDFKVRFHVCVWEFDVRKGTNHLAWNEMKEKSHRTTSDFLLLC